ncbi:type II toxin-antitoxin system VapC family toxin [Spirosoma rhododendri]|uniref:Type II toxin-antitoxin system VapC family toxin n=1 Tax=Spirosoma rhododendri TaxID=2728024 RepID=A0A7L5DQR3_9BACT|nr:type II toxin-antitoxin system VapC family toxin [Spirosoma rhododendri]
MNLLLDTHVVIRYITGDESLPERWREMTHVLAYQQLPLHHRDPFDRMLIAQAQVEQLTVMTQDANFPLYDVVLFR